MNSHCTKMLCGQMKSSVLLGKIGTRFFFLVRYIKALGGNAVKTEVVFKRVSVPAKLSSL